MEQLAKVGDVIETQVKYPAPGVIRIRLDTPLACAEANRLLLDKASDWALVAPKDDRREKYRITPTH